MDYSVIAFWANILLLVLFVIFIWHRHSFKSFSRMNWVAIILSIVLLALVIFQILDNRSSEPWPLQGLLIAISVAMFVVFLLFLTRIFTAEKMKSILHFDERLTAANVKSARNALVAVFLSAIIDLIISVEVNRELLLGILGVSLIVYLASMLIYYYRSF